jgi:hypothetical protein
VFIYLINKIAIIGHGPSLYGKNLGEYIDSFKYVFRFPYSGNWQTEKDYGTKISYCCATVNRIKKLNIVAEHGYFLWSKRRAVIGKHQLHNVEDVTGLIKLWQKRLPKGAYPFFSHGTAAICIACARFKLPVVVLGCDALKTGEADPKKYFGSWV